MTESINVDSNLSHPETTAAGIKEELLHWCQYDKLQALFLPKNEFLLFQIAQKTLFLSSHSTPEQFLLMSCSESLLMKLFILVDA